MSAICRNCGTKQEIRVRVFDCPGCGKEICDDCKQGHMTEAVDIHAKRADPLSYLAPLGPRGNLKTNTDTERLDWLQSQTTGYGNGWLARGSTTERGFRLHETEDERAVPLVREAIDAAMKLIYCGHCDELTDHSTQNCVLPIVN